ncbi:MAG TPA: pyridoxal-phosphate dependent enzyme, partial [Candidatus Limnocylindrales bacterium]
REARVGQVVDEVATAGGRPYVIGVGGTGAIGAYGQLLAAQELGAQAADAGVTFARVVLPTATGGTQAGLLAGLPESIAVSGIVVARTADALRPVIATTAAALGRDVDPEDIDLDQRFLGAGYGRPSDAAAEAADLLARAEAILVDPIYTAKGLAGLIAGVRSGAWDGERIVFWHAGGLPGLFEPLDEPD